MGRLTKGKRVKFFYAFLEELGHFKHKIKSVTMTSDPDIVSK